jgi:hypothetical protein
MVAARSPGRHVDRPAERQCVVRHDEEAKVGDGVLDLGALPEADAADDDVRDRPPHQLRLERARLGVDAEQHGDLAGRHGRPQAVDLLGDDQRLVGLVGGLDEHDRRPAPACEVSSAAGCGC